MLRGTRDATSPLRHLRGETQTLSLVPVGSVLDDRQRSSALVGPDRKSFMLHYSFP